MGCMTRSGTDVWKTLMKEIAGIIVIYLIAFVIKFFVEGKIVPTIRMCIFV